MALLSKDSGRKGVSGGLILAFLLVASLWAATYFGAEARVRRSTIRVIALAGKEGDESPVSLGLAANRLGSFLATNSVLELEGFGALATGRREIVSAFAQIRSSLAVVAFEQPAVVAVAADNGTVDAHVKARYRLESEAGEIAEGDGQAVLHWLKGENGWQIVRAVLQAEDGAKMPGGWK